MAIVGGEATGEGWAAATVAVGEAARAAVGVAAVDWDAICSWALFKSFVRIWIWSCIDKISCSILELGCSPRILSIRRVAATTSSMVRHASFCTSAAKEQFIAPRKASMAWHSAASSSRGCRRLASFSASPASSYISLEPRFSCLSAAQASSLTEPTPRRDSSVSLAIFQDASSSRPARMLDPVVPIRSWHQVILALSVFPSPSWNLCSSSANQSDNTCCR